MAETIEVYKVTNEQLELINNYNSTKENVIMTVCSYVKDEEEFNAVVLSDLQSEDFADYLALLGELDQDQIVEIELKDPFNV